MSHTPVRVLVAYPRGARTGGPEALHQLVDSLRRLGVDAWLWPFPGTRANERVSEYERYDAPETTEMMDEVGTVVVLPETSLDLATLWGRAEVSCWWLSIDNSPYFSTRRWLKNARVDGTSSSGLLSVRAFIGSQRRVIRDRAVLGRITHLTQSRYAWNFVRRALWVSPTMLGDYIPDAERCAAESKPGALSVAYNPAKGQELTDQIRTLSDPSLEWLAVEGLSREGVGAMLDRATVYLETGHQPGRDRMPREAALHGCVVLMLRRGAGRNREDCPLADEYKIEPGPMAAKQFTTALGEVLADVAFHRRRQQAYVDMALSDRATFDRAVEGVFVEGRRGVESWQRQ